MNKEKFFMAFDTETGSRDPKEADLLTFYAAIIDEDFKLVEELYLKLKPDDGKCPIAHAEALKVNKIDITSHLKDPETITYSEGKKRLYLMLKKYAKKVGKTNNIRPMGYNVPFDIKWTQHYLISEKEWETLFHYKYVDVMQSVDFLRDSGWFPKDIGSLTSVVDYLQIPHRSAHNSREDTLMTVDVYKKILEIMSSKKDGGQAQDLISLLEAE